MKKLALVLGGGAAKGYAHIGVIKALEKAGIQPDLIVGTSMGALVGGMYASGKTVSQMESLAKNFNSLGGFNLFTTLFKDNILSANRITKILNKELGELRHEDCKIKFVAIATDIINGQEQQFQTGALKDSILASISIPGVFPRVKIEGKTFVDGGLVNNLPEDVAKELMPDAVILSIDVLGEYSKQVEKCKIKTLETMVNAITLLMVNSIKSKQQFADIRLSMSLPTISQLDFRKETTERSINMGENFMKKHINKIIQKLKEE